MNQTSEKRKRGFQFEALESRMLMASVGWDGPGRGAAVLSYHISGTPTGLTAQQVESSIQTALSAWSAVANISFVKASRAGLANSLDISFRRIDGAGGALAQAYFPNDVTRSRLAGDIQFDTAERWEIGNGLGNRAFDLTQVAAHEIGHALGLEHSSQAGSVLLPSVSPSQVFRGLSSSDRTAILRLYAARTTTRGAASIAVAAPTFSVVGDQGNASSKLSDVGDTTTSNQHLGLVQQLFNQLDVDQSNSLTADEVAESVWESFSALDGNADGGVTLKELKVDRVVLLDGLFAAFDENGDGVLSTDEIPESAADRLQDGDTDADGTISKEEFSDLNEQRTRCGNLGSLISGLLRRRTGRF